MKEIRILMGMPITVEVVDRNAAQENLNKVFSFFEYIDSKFSTYKDASEISLINRGELNPSESSNDIKTILTLCEETKKKTGGYFDIKNSDGKLDPSGLVKGWSIWKAAEILKQDGFKNFYIDAGGDIETSGSNSKGEKWSIGIKNPFDQKKIVKVLYLSSGGVATSGTYIRGQHIYNPLNNRPADDIASMTVIGPNIYEADRFATAAFAMGRAGINLIENLADLEGYMIDKNGIATMTSGFSRYTQ